MSAELAVFGTAPQTGASVGNPKAMPGPDAAPKALAGTHGTAVQGLLLIVRERMDGLRAQPVSG